MPDARAEGEPLAVVSDEVAESMGARLLSEPPPRARTEAERDRDRVLYSSAFLRLGHVTQVAAPETGHPFHSRLTHSLKVAQVAHGLARELQQQAELGPAGKRLVALLDPYAAEAAALAHDLGHPPFGHLAERVLQDRSSKATFEGNPQSFRIVTQLALRSIEPVGLNLSRQTLNGLLKYPWLRAESPPWRAKKWGAYDGDRRAFVWAREGLPDDRRTLEASLMDWADDVTYAVHDIDDFFRAGLVPLDRLSTDPEELRAFQAYLKGQSDASDDEGDRLAAVAERVLATGDLSSIRRPFGGRADERIDLRALGSDLISRYISAVELHDAGEGDEVLLRISQEILDQVAVLKQLTWYYVINRPSLAVIQRGQETIIGSLYSLFREAVEKQDLHVLPKASAERAANAGDDPAEVERVVIDLIAGMTEGSAIEVYKQRQGVSAGSLLQQALGPS